jgi:hypothetical protein
MDEFYHNETRIDAKVHEEPTTGCWLWGGSISQNGYGRVSVNNRNSYVHRVMYEEHHGPVPDGFHVDHKCRNRACCNPDHLEAVLPIENMFRAAVANGGGRG